MNKFNMNNKIAVGFDMDGVILDNADSKIRIAKSLGFDIKLHHTPSEIIRTILPQVVLEKLQSILYDNHEVALSTPLMRGVRTIMADLSKKNIPVFLISRRKIPKVAIKILKKHLLWPKYFNDKNSFFVMHPEDKNFQAAQLGVTHYIDDELKIINALSSVKNKFLFDQFNVFDGADNYTKINSWPEFKKHI
ncbi:MAG: hypothetical protein A3C61_02265 [Candidatus Yanofskybacteria bacterium RIFCSPHIGHO2_02_FULL_39_10]|uniref:Uncharacterized protein n=1 Tax=Candidatus Yanofskybacteria bacterium RIFCSPHIGHO2_02_FULL_39_10 TaxID=1802674 RepID=A0A1F8F485_9BACT|nr:MAG: hypothetical protein A3C61_02265 [Candidatus Yanofskybacteria bacterium RIFCSPHIGHO2_02_FULL_39_10]